MSTKTTIEWTRNDDGTAGRTWNVVSGCDKVSPGCDHCYAENIARRFAGSKAFPDGFAVTLHLDRLTDPLRWRKPTRVFVNSMSDMFHSDISSEVIARMFAVMAVTPQHTYQILTKRHARMRSLLNSGAFADMVTAAVYRDFTPSQLGPDVADHVITHFVATRLKGEPMRPLPNVHLGVSVEDQRWANLRIPALLGTPAAVRFLSCEPLLGPIDLVGDVHAGHEYDDVNGYPHAPVCLTCSTEDEEVEYFRRDRSIPGLSWVIAGAESGPGARPMDLDWVRSLRDQCVEAGVAFFFKQDAVNGKKVPTPELDGRVWVEMPRVREVSA